MRQWNKPDLQAYMTDPSSVREHEVLTEDQLILERVMLSLRTSAGIPADFLRAHCDPQALSRALSAGHLCPSSAPDPRLRIPESRFFISDSIISELV